MGSVNLDNTGSGSAITLSSDGTSLLLDGTAIGGGGGGSPTLYAESLSGATSPTATGTNSVAIGSDAQATATNGSIAFGTATRASGNANAAIGYQANAAGVGALATGYLANAAADFSTAVGRNAKTATGSNATALTNSYASGANSFAAAIANNTSTYGATGSGSVAMMNYAKASGSNSGAIGFGANATGSFAHAFGAQSFSTASSSLALGRQCQATANYATSIGRGAINPIKGSFKFSGSYFSAAGDSQIGMYPLQIDTSDATPVVLVTDENSTPGAGTTNQVVLPNNSAYSFSGTIIARQQAADGSNYASWEIKGALLRDANAASTVLGNGIVNKLFATAGASAWAIALTADTTNGGLKVEATGAAATDIRWVATVNTSEVTYA